MDPEMPSWNESKIQEDPSRRTSIFVRILLVLLLGLSLLIGVLVVTRQSESKKSSSRQASASIATIVITSNAFQPATLRVKKGQSVTWVNQDASAHRVVSGPHPSHTSLPDLDSEDPLAKGDSYTYTFEKTGTFSYHDEADPLKVVGTIIVE